MSNSNVVKFKNIDDVNSGYQNTSGWFKKLHTKNSVSNRELDIHPILRLKNVDDVNVIFILFSQAIQQSDNLYLLLCLLDPIFHLWSL